MKRKTYLVLIIAVSLLSFTSCKVSKQYVQHISKKAEIVAPQTKKVIVIATDDVRVNEFSKTFEKNFKSKRDFANNYLYDFSNKINSKYIYDNVSIDISNSTYDSLKNKNTDYVIHFSNFEITNRIEWNNSGGIGMNGMGGMNTSTSVEYCIINIKVEVYDAKTDKEILDFVAIGEASVFLFNFTKTFEKAKQRSIDHIINFLKTGRTEYEKY
jgi:hypothetical protein